MSKKDKAKTEVVKDIQSYTDVELLTIVNERAKDKSALKSLTGTCIKLATVKKPKIKIEIEGEDVTEEFEKVDRDAIKEKIEKKREELAKEREKAAKGRKKAGEKTDVEKIEDAKKDE